VPLPTIPLPATPPDQLLQPTPSPSPTSPSELIPGTVPTAIPVTRINVVGSTVFPPEEFAKITKPYVDKGTISLAELFQVRDEITRLYFNKGYITSGAYIPPQELTNGVIEIKISEGGIEDIQVKGTRHLNPNYIRSRLALATTTPLKQDRLIQALQILQLQDKLIKTISADLSTGTQPGQSLLTVTVTEAPRWEAQLTLDNGRTPSVGSFRRQFQLTNYDLLGFGDILLIAYTNTAGSNAVDTSYTIPFNPRNGTISISGGFAFNRVIEEPFDILDIHSYSNYINLTVRQPIFQTVNQEFALGLTLGHQESGATLLDGEIPFPSPGSDDEGNTRITSLQFFQDYILRTNQQVLALRSQFTFGINAFNATIKDIPPDSNFFAWRGQAQYVWQWAPQTLLLLRGDVQLADRPLVPLEQFGIGGIESVRGYRQDQLLTDNGVFLSAEVRIPILRLNQPRITLQLAPFVDFGYGFNNSGQFTAPLPYNTLASVGLGLRFQFSDRLTARFDWGVPLVNAPIEKQTLQEQGFYFSLIYNQPF
jgi:hemolysin activation/secretion protein